MESNKGIDYFISACKDGEIEKVKEYLRENIDINAKGGLFDNTTALASAAYSGHLDIVKLLIENKADVNVKSQFGETALQNAIKNLHFDVTKILIENNANIEQQDDFGMNSLMEATIYGSIEIVKYLLNQGANMEARNETNGRTPISYAVEYLRSDIFKFYLDRGAELHAIDNDGNTLLMIAATAGNLDTLKYLVERGLDINAADSYGYTPFLNACENGRVDVVKYLLEKKVKLDCKTNQGRNALIVACFNRQSTKSVELVEILLKTGAFDINTQDDEGQTALTEAVRDGNLDTIKFLIENNAKIDITDNNGTTLLMHAVKKSSLELTKYFVEKGLDVKASDKDGKTALMFACDSMSLSFELVQYLCEHGASVYEVDNNSNNPASIAASHFNKKTAMFLVNKMHGDDIILPSRAVTGGDVLAYLVSNKYVRSTVLIGTIIGIMYAIRSKSN